MSTYEAFMYGFGGGFLAGALTAVVIFAKAIRRFR